MYIYMYLHTIHTYGMRQKGSYLGERRRSVRKGEGDDEGEGDAEGEGDEGW